MLDRLYPLALIVLKEEASTLNSYYALMENKQGPTQHKQWHTTAVSSYFIASVFFNYGKHFKI